MKATIKKTAQNKQFKPFEITFKVDSIEEARLLYHVFNYVDIADVLKKDAIYFERYSLNCACDFEGRVYNIVAEEIEAQGFEI